MNLYRCLTITFILTALLPTSFSYAASWTNKFETDISPIFKDSPDVDNSSAIYGSRFGVANYFYSNSTKFGQLEAGIDGSVLYLKTSQRTNGQNYSKSIAILSPAIVARWYPVKWDSVAPFIQAGVGPSYMTNNDFEGRKLGKHFVFQDIFSMGLKTINPKNNNELLFGVYVIHYSNAGLHKDNRGITLPISARFGYRF